MDKDGRDDVQTIILDESADYYRELSEYLEVLSNSQRLRIIKILEKGPAEVRKIASEIDTSYENTKKHLDRLLSTGLIKKEAGLGQATSKGMHPVWKYSLVPGAMEAIVRNLSLFGNMRINLIDPDMRKRLDAVRAQVATELKANDPLIVVLGGSDDGKVFPLRGVSVKAGRVDPGHELKYDPALDVVLAGEYSAVSRVSKPHGRFVNEEGRWYIEDNGSTGGTTVNTVSLGKGSRSPLRDGDLIELAKGPKGAKLLVIMTGEVPPV
ncbi:MAG: FHA domain-containing protein [Methanoregulaceae archaeon]|nr:FHA domain-containing protein [Methanoregulaceae archaeon]